MTNYTHIFIRSTRESFPMSEAHRVAKTTEAMAFGFNLYDQDRAKFDKNGDLCHRTGGWSYGHVQNGFICAGAGGLNSMPVIKL